MALKIGDFVYISGTSYGIHGIYAGNGRAITIRENPYGCGLNHSWTTGNMKKMDGSTLSHTTKKYYLKLQKILRKGGIKKANEIINSVDKGADYTNKLLGVKLTCKQGFHKWEPASGVGGTLGYKCTRCGTFAESQRQGD